MHEVKARLGKIAFSLMVISNILLGMPGDTQTMVKNASSRKVKMTIIVNNVYHNQKWAITIGQINGNAQFKLSKVGQSIYLDPKSSYDMQTFSSNGEGCAEWPMALRFDDGANSLCCNLTGKKIMSKLTRGENGKQTIRMLSQNLRADDGGHDAPFVTIYE